MFKRLLVPLDGSENAERALGVAQELAKSYEGELLLVHVVTRRPELEALHSADTVYTLEVSRDLARDLIRAQRERGEKYLADIASRLQGAGVRTSTEVREGAADEQIVAVARERGADVIVMTPRGLGGLRRLLLGSVTDRVIRSSPVPVLVVPA